MSNLIIAEQFFRSFALKDIPSMANLIDPEMIYFGPVQSLKGKVEFLDAVERMCPIFTRLNIKGVFEDNNQLVSIYEIDCPPPINLFTVLALLRIKDNLIYQMEAIYDGKVYKKFEDKYLSSK